MKQFFLLAALIFSTTSVLLGGGDPKVKKILQKMVEVTQKGPYSIDLNAEMKINQMGASMKMTMDGNMLIADPTHIRSTINATMQMPQGNPDMPSEMDVAMKQIFDGQIMWMEVEMKQMGVTQVMKMSLEAMKKQAESMGVNLPGGGLMDPATMIQNMEKIMDLEFVRQKDGKVFLRAEIKGKILAKMGGGGTGIGAFEMVIDQKNIFPMELRMMMGEEPFMNMKMSNYKLVDKGSIPADTFTYTPAEGATIMDLDAMMSGSQQ